MPTWRCPHCGVPQAPAARCWVCHRSTTGCGTCRNYRRAVAGNLGFCGLDRTHAALTGDEIRPCWQPSDGMLPRGFAAAGEDSIRPTLPLIAPLWVDEG